MTPQQEKEMVEIKDDIKSIRVHLANIKLRQDNEDVARIVRDAKIDIIANSLTDNPFNADNGLIKRINRIEKIAETHVLYWQVAIGTTTGGLGLWFIINVLFK